MTRTASGATPLLMARTGKRPKGVPPLVLASLSAVRARMLAAAGLAFEVRAAPVDEEEAKRALKADGAAPEDIAETLAELKARRVSAQMPEALVIGADQVLVAEGVMFDKPSSLKEAREHLRRLRGKRHELITSAVVARVGARIWHHTARARLLMRPFGDAFLDDYLKALGEDALASVGAYQIEGLGAQLFSAVEGDLFTIQGLPLLPLLEFLRVHGVVAR